MRVVRYDKLSVFRADVMPALLADEAHNNLLISTISADSPGNTIDWFMGTVVDSVGKTVLIAFCTKPFNLLLYAPDVFVDPDDSSTGKIDEAVRVLADEFIRIDFKMPGVFADTALAKCFADAYIAGCRTGGVGGVGSVGDVGSVGGIGSVGDRRTAVSFSRPMLAMSLEVLLPYEKAPGNCRMLTEDDLTFVPLWEQEFCADCRIPAYPLDENTERIRTRIGRDSHFIWEDGLPVSQAVYGRETPNGAVINWVYTPPMYRGRSYATSVVGELCSYVLKRGKKFCCLFADAQNPVSCGIYRKLGFHDAGEFLEIHFW